MRMHNNIVKFHSPIRAWLVVIVFVVSLSACGLVPQATYSTVEELKTAYVKAGGECGDWDATHAVEGSAESGTCGTHAVLSTYVSPAATQERVEKTKSFLQTVGGDWGSWLVGENWIISSPDVREVKDELGGTVVSIQD